MGEARGGGQRAPTAGTPPHPGPGRLPGRRLQRGTCRASWTVGQAEWEGVMSHCRQRVCSREDSGKCKRFRGKAGSAGTGRRVREGGGGGGVLVSDR